LSHAEAAALPLAGLTAWQALVDTAQVAAGQRVLIHGAGGGVGHLAVQIAKARGAHVIGTASAAKHDLVASLGADELIDYRATDFTALVDGVDVVLDTIGGDIARRSIGVLHPGGLLVTIVDRRDVDLAARTRTAGRRFAGLSVEPDYPALEALAKYYEHRERNYRMALEMTAAAFDLEPALCTERPEVTVAMGDPELGLE